MTASRGLRAGWRWKLAPSVTPTVIVQKERDWLDGAAKSPKEKVVKESLKEIPRG
jgi:hypothetical protein